MRVEGGLDDRSSEVMCVDVRGGRTGGSCVRRGECWSQRSRLLTSTLRIWALSALDVIFPSGA